MTDKNKIDNLIKDFINDNKTINEKGIHRVVNKSNIITDKKETTKILHENNPSSGGTVIHGENTKVVHNHKSIDYKIDNTAIDQGRSSIGIRKRGERVDPKCMSPREFENYLYYTFNIPGKKGWNGIERSDFAQNWEPDKSQNIKTKEEALKYLKITKNKNAPDGIEKRESTRRVGKKDIRKHKIDRRTLKQRRKDDITNNSIYIITVIILLMVIILWVYFSVYYKLKGVI